MPRDEESPTRTNREQRDDESSLLQMMPGAAEGEEIWLMQEVPDQVIPEHRVQEFEEEFRWRVVRARRQSLGHARAFLSICATTFARGVRSKLQGVRQMATSLQRVLDFYVERIEEVEEIHDEMHTTWLKRFWRRVRNQARYRANRAREERQRVEQAVMDDDSDVEIHFPGEQADGALPVVRDALPEERERPAMLEVGGEGADEELLPLQNGHPQDTLLDPAEEDREVPLQMEKLEKKKGTGMLRDEPQKVHLKDNVNKARELNLVTLTATRCSSCSRTPTGYNLFRTTWKPCAPVALRSEATPNNYEHIVRA